MPRLSVVGKADSALCLALDVAGYFENGLARHWFSPQYKRSI
jgi:hypothetical protein